MTLAMGAAGRLEHRHVALCAREPSARRLPQQELLPDLARGPRAADARARPCRTRTRSRPGKPLHPAKPVAKTLTPDGVAAMLHRGGPTEREADGAALFSRRRPRAREKHPSADPHAAAALCARPCRHHRAACTAVHVFPDTNAHGRRRKPAVALHRAFRRPRAVGRRQPIRR